MNRFAALLGFATLALPSAAQSGVSAVLLANTPIVVTHTDPSGTTTASQPAGVLLDGPGIDLGNGQWALPVPPLPAGLDVHFQHASMGSWNGQVRFGLTNVVRYQT